MAHIHESVSPRPPSIPLGPFWIFSKIRKDIHEWIFIAGVNPSNGEITKKPKLFTSVNDTPDQLFGGVNDTGD
jgi:hypothetical protein